MALLLRILSSRVTWYAAGFVALFLAYQWFTDVLATNEQLRQDKARLEQQIENMRRIEKATDTAVRNSETIDAETRTWVARVKQIEEEVIENATTEDKDRPISPIMRGVFERLRDE